MSALTGILKGVATVTLSLWLISAADLPALAAPPTNDQFANAQVLSGTSGSVNGTNTEATREDGEPSDGSAQPIQSVWYSWTAPVDGRFTFDLCLTETFDTTVIAFTGSAMDSLTYVASNDDACGPNEWMSAITFPAGSGTTYRIAVDGNDTDTGAFTLRWYVSNDNFADAKVVSGTSGSVESNNIGFSGETGEPDNAGVSSPIQSAWYKWTAPEAGNFTFNTCSTVGFDTTLGVYVGNAVNNLSSIAQNNDACGFGLQSSVVFPAQAGTTYFVSVDGRASETRRFTLSWDVAPATADLSLETSDRPDPVTSGARVTYTMLVENGGPDAATQVILFGTVIGRFNSFTTTQGSCDVPAAGETGPMECDLGTIPNGSSATVILKVTAVGSELLQQSNAVDAAETDPDLADRFWTEYTNVNESKLLRNGGFELDTNGDSSPDSWTRNSHFVRQASSATAGSYAGRHHATDNSTYTVQQTIPRLAARKKFTFFGRLRIPTTTDDFSFGLHVRWRNSSNKTIRTDVIATYTSAEASGAWEDVFAQVRSPRGTARAQIRMMVSKLDGTIYVDEFMFGNAGS